ncbi:alpha-galactosidase A [Mariannaea sp. PMI_226]|nr:alpha-galactosidase A [Mariannaea sp. PMI_226]
MAAPRIISMDFSTAGRDDCYFRILTGHTVKYVTIQACALDADSLMDMPLSFQDILPELPYGESHWNSAYVSRNAAAGKLEATLEKKDLPGVETVWHQKKIDFLDLQRTQQLTLLAQECTTNSGSLASYSQSEKCEQSTIIAKIARFPWEIQYVEAETRIYKLLQSSAIAPRFLGHVHEEGRVIGFLIEKVEGRRARMADLDTCQRALGRLHSLGVLHGDPNRHNFIIDSNHEAVLIDFEKAVVNPDVKSLENEMASLREQLSEDTGRGGGFGTIE